MYIEYVNSVNKLNQKQFCFFEKHAVHELTRVSSCKHTETGAAESPVTCLHYSRPFISKILSIREVQKCNTIQMAKQQNKNQEAARDQSSS